MKRKRKNSRIRQILNFLVRKIFDLVVLYLCLALLYYLILWIVIYFGARCADPVYIDGLPPQC